MKHWLLAIFAVGFAIPDASAADLPASSAPVRAAPAQLAPAPVPIFTWTGVYAGINAGHTFNGGLPTPAAYNFPEILTFYAADNADGTLAGGGQVGFNWQYGGLVFGAEADINFMDPDRQRAAVPADPTLPYAVLDSKGWSWFATIRPRLGFAAGPVLVYGTGGIAFGDGSSDSVLFVNGPGAPLECTSGCRFVTSDRDAQVGWALGAGVEYAIAPGVSLKVEYLHIDLSNRTRVFRPSVPAVQHITLRGNDKVDLVRAGINVRF